MTPRGGNYSTRRYKTNLGSIPNPVIARLNLRDLIPSHYDPSACSIHQDLEAFSKTHTAVYDMADKKRLKNPSSAFKVANYPLKVGSQF